MPSVQLNVAPAMPALPEIVTLSKPLNVGRLLLSIKSGKYPLEGGASDEI